MSKYATDDKGNIPKRNDHLIDCVRYLNSVSHYNMHEVIEAIKMKKAELEGRFRSHQFDDSIEKLNEDWTSDIFSDF
jgi:hypothetical protein